MSSPEGLPSLSDGSTFDSSPSSSSSPAALSPLPVFSSPSAMSSLAPPCSAASSFSCSAASSFSYSAASSFSCLVFLRLVFLLLVSFAFLLLGSLVLVILCGGVQLRRAPLIALLPFFVPGFVQACAVGPLVRDQRGKRRRSAGSLAS